ncbi:hypothetical protein BDZ94DRAFT_53176 [Collybia nuda]|uniref:F-box domain-containing protein n=1 Tax=Collybia nuda TaxID=64659 RepID=A0A9P6CIA3_9AGAR|nr:hypothetical protein BDZ94DRAFT_53176 [Collybia nuda]
MNDNHQNTLPPELTSLIFTFATHHSHSPNSGSLVPLSISHVSRHWRAIALSTGSLWTSITISPPSNPALISTYLTRSSPYPIDLTYTTTTTTTTATHTNAYRHQPQPHPTESKHDIHIGSIFALIAPHLVRLQSFHVASTLFQDLPNLTSLQLYGHRLNKISEILLSLGAPALEDLVIAPIVPNDLVGLLRATQSSPSSPSPSSSSPPSTSTPPHSHFPALQNLTLAPAHSSALTVLRAASACFPGVKRLAFANVYVDGFRDVFVDCGSECGCGCGCGCRCLSDTESGSEPEFEFEFESEFEHSSNSKLEKGERPDPHQHQHQHQHHQHSKQKQKQKQKPKPFPFPDLRTLSLRHVGAIQGR